MELRETGTLPKVGGSLAQQEYHLEAETLRNH